MTLGNVGKASQADFAAKRTVLLVPYVVATRDDQELHDLVSTYWEEAMAQVRKLETSLGSVESVFHEGSVGSGDEAVRALEHGNPMGYPHLRAFFDRGAVLQPTEDVQALSETLDLHRCLSVVQSSQSVMHRLMDWFEETRKRRYTAIAHHVDSSMEPRSVAMLVASPDHEIQFPKDIEVVYIVPPVLDKINRWLRENRTAGMAQDPGEGAGEQEGQEQESPG